MKRPWRTLVLILALLMLAVRSSAQELPVVRIGMSPVESEAGIYYAEDLGYFRRAGVNVKIQNLAGGAAITAAVASGSLDVGASNALSLANAFLRGIAVKMIASGSLYSPSAPQILLVVAPDRPTPTAAELNGKVFCGVSVGGLDQLAVLAWMDKTGGDASTIKFVEVPNAAQPEALAQGRVDACVLTDPALSSAVTGKRVKPISRVYGVAFGERFSLVVFFGSNEWLAANPAVAKRFVSALNEAQLWASTHPEEAAVILERYTKLHVPRAQMVVTRGLDGGIVQPILDVAAKYKLISRPMKATEFLWEVPK
jgi:NitT/TauT family transport system substrate-binding protein